MTTPSPFGTETPNVKTLTGLRPQTAPDGKQPAVKTPEPGASEVERFFGGARPADPLAAAAVAAAAPAAPGAKPAEGKAKDPAAPATPGATPTEPAAATPGATPESATAKPGEAKPGEAKPGDAKSTTAPLSTNALLNFLSPSGSRTGTGSTAANPNAPEQPAAKPPAPKPNPVRETIFRPTTTLLRESEPPQPASRRSSESRSTSTSSTSSQAARAEEVAETETRAAEAATQNQLSNEEVLKVQMEVDYAGDGAITASDLRDFSRTLQSRLDSLEWEMRREGGSSEVQSAQRSRLQEKLNLTQGVTSRLESNEVPPPQPQTAQSLSVFGTVSFDGLF